MREKLRILVVEDDPKVVIFVADTLEHLGFDVSIARDGIEGLEKARTDRPDLLVLDVMMPKMDGYEVCHILKSDPSTSHIPVLMLTARGQLQDKVRGFEIGADDYLPKPYDKAEFEARVKTLLKRSRTMPFDEIDKASIFSLSCRPEQRINIRISGRLSLISTTKNILDMDTNAISRLTDIASLIDWRFNSKNIGKSLFHDIFVSHPEILSSFNSSIGSVEREEFLHLRFEATRDLLRVPFEFLYDDLDKGDYLVLRHPVVRSITGVKVKRLPLSPVFLNTLWKKREVLKILLVASNTIPSIPGVDEEIEVLGNLLPKVFKEKDITIHIKTILSEQATYTSVRDELVKNKYHILHYAGHGNYDKESPEQSYLSFWEQSNCKGAIKKLPVSELTYLLRDTEFKFVYLSCCYGMKTGDITTFLDDDFIGIADGIIQAGIPSVLGFRWPVSDNEARDFASKFYKSLAEQGFVDIALFHARREIASQNRDDITWISPIMIIQG